MVAWLRRGGGADAVTYRASENARAFHRPGCRFYDSVGATIEFTRPTDAIAAGFTPCKVCKP
jgi:methylphosphotriester-DNA--protein-cysteine methyltransferase